MKTINGFIARGPAQYSQASLNMYSSFRRIHVNLTHAAGSSIYYAQRDKIFRIEEYARLYLKDFFDFRGYKI